MRTDIKEALNRNKEVNKFFNTLMFKGMIKGVEKYLKKDEMVKYIRNANVQMNQTNKLKPNTLSIKGKQPVVIVITDKRILIYHKIFPNEKLEQLPVDEIRAYDFNKGMTSSKLRITSLTKSVDVDLTCNIKEIKLLNDTLEEVTTKGQQNNEGITLSTDVIKTLRELAELKEEGIITDKEFEKKKTELLPKI